MIDIGKLTPAELDRFLHLQSIVDRQATAQNKVRALRDYYAGNHPVLLTKRQQEFLGPLVHEQSFTFAHNLVRTVVDTLRERLQVVGFAVNGESASDVDDDEESSPAADVAALLWRWWNVNRLDSQQIRLYRERLAN